MNAIKIALVATAALSVAAPAFAQYQQSPQYQGGPYQPSGQYQQQSDNYRRDSDDYAMKKAEYERARNEYQQRRDRYLAERARYDARWGAGTYDRRYGPAPTWDDSDANLYARDSAYTGAYVDPCRQRSNNNNGQIAGGLIGALAGAALGSNVAARNAKTEGTVLGAVVGGVIGANVGKAASAAHCDEAGYYYNYSETRPYKESRYARSDNYYSYQQQRCRLAPAPVDRTGDVRYVRVCPDNQGRYRFTPG